MRRLNDLEQRLRFLEANTPKGGTACCPPYTIDDMEVPSRVWAARWDDSTAWTPANNTTWQDDATAVTLDILRVSTVVVTGLVEFDDATAARQAFMDFRWNLDGVNGMETGAIYNSAAGYGTVTQPGVWFNVDIGPRVLKLQASKTNVAWQADAVTIRERKVSIIVIPEGTPSPVPQTYDPWIVVRMPMPVVIGTGEPDGWISERQPYPEHAEV